MLVTQDAKPLPGVYRIAKAVGTAIMDFTAPNQLRFGLFELNLRSRELRRGGMQVRLQEQPFEILRMMLERQGDVVTRDELRQRLWPEGTFVDFEHSLNAAIKRLRAALGDEADNPRYIETLPRRGYRFIGEGTQGLRPAITGGPQEPRVVAVTSSHTHLTRIAVLPFTNLGGSASQEYFGDGLTEEMIMQLGRLCGGRIGVIARWSSMMFRDSSRSAREIGEALRVEYLLEGSVRREGDRVRITARLVETAGETHLWAETYDRHLTDCFSVQADVAERIARSLAMELLPEQRTAGASCSDAAAYQSYLKGRFYWNKPGDDGLNEAIFYFNQALERDPAFAAAHAARARAHIAKAEYYDEMPRTALGTAQSSAARALELDPGLAEGHLALGDVQRLLAWDWTGAEAAYRQAIGLNPSLEGAHRAYGVMLAALSRLDEAAREVDRAMELDPLCLVVGSSAAWVRYLAGDYAGAIERCRHTIDMDAKYGFSVGRRLLGAAHLQAGQSRQAVAEMEVAVTHAGPEPVLVTWLAHAKAVTGDAAGARVLLKALFARRTLRHLPSYHLALAYTGLGDSDAAFASLDQACADRDPVIANIAVEPRFAPLRSDPRYRGLVRRLGLAVPGDVQHAAHTA